MMVSRAVAFLLAVLMAGLTPPAGAATSVVVDLGVEGRAMAINERQQVVINGQSGQAYLWELGELTPLGDLGGGSTRAADINQRGMVVGSSMTDDGRWHAFVWSQGAMTDLGTLGGASSHATAINSRGQVVGVRETSDGRTAAFLWQGGRMIDLSLEGGPSRAADINDRGMVVGSGGSAEGVEQAVVWTAAHGTVYLPAPLYDPLDLPLTATAVNDRGDVVGMSLGVLAWPKAGEVVGASIPVGFSSWATGINARGLVSGTASDEDSGRNAFVWDLASGETRILPRAEGTSRLSDAWSTWAEDLNNSGAVVGSMVVPTTDPPDHEHRMERAVLWR